MASLDFEKESENFKEFYALNGEMLTDAAESFRTLIGLLLSDQDNFSTPRVIARVKNRNECITKFENKYLKICEDKQIPFEISDYITDLIGIRVICLYETDISFIHSVINDNFEIIEETDKTHALEIQENVFGYKGLHLDLRLNPSRQGLPEYCRFSRMRFELQIRTIVQDAWSTVDHKIKYKRNIPNSLKRRINRLAALFELADQEFVNIHNETINLEEQASDFQTGNHQHTSERLNAFSFLSIAETYFPNYHFVGTRVDDFVADLLEANSSISAPDLKIALDNYNSQLEEYRSHIKQNFLGELNPYTTIRHALYLNNKSLYSSLLFEFQKNGLQKWLEERSES